MVLHGEEGYNIGYVLHEILSHIEPHESEEVDFESDETAGGEEDE